MGLVLLSHSRAEPGGAVVELTTSAFDETVLPDERWLVAFTAPWCSHCKKLAPVYRAAAERLSDKVRFGTVDATAEKKLAKRFEVSGYPTIMYMHAGSRRSYGGDKTIVGFAEYAARVTGPTVHAAKSVGALREQLGAIGRAFVLAGTPATLSSGHMRDAFYGVAAERFDELTCAQVAGADAVRSLLKLRAPPPSAAGGGSAEAELALAPDEPLIGVLDGEWFEPFVSDVYPDATADALREWVAERAWPSVAAVTSANFWKLRKLTLPLALALVDPRVYELARAQQAQMADHARTHRGVLQFGWVDGVELGEFWQSEYGVQPGALPTLLVLKPKAKGDHEFHWRALNGTAPLAGAEEQRAFLRAILDGELEPERSGEPWSLFATLSRSLGALKSFASENPKFFCGCLALNIFFLCSLFLGGSPEGLEAARARGGERLRKKDE
jgi:protein disulfide-isomerase-like protein